MQSAKDEVQSISAIARSLVVGQAFKTNVLAFPSQAERTLDRYSAGYQSKGGTSCGYQSEGGYRSDSDTRRFKGKSKGLGHRDNCFGCGDALHPWMVDGKVMCPNADKPGIRAAAQANYEK
jgi:hypothetical protein